MIATAGVSPPRCAPCSGLELGPQHLPSPPCAGTIEALNENMKWFVTPWRPRQNSEKQLSPKSSNRTRITVHDFGTVLWSAGNLSFKYNPHHDKNHPTGSSLERPQTNKASAHEPTEGPISKLKKCCPETTQCLASANVKAETEKWHWE